MLFLYEVDKSGCCRQFRTARRVPGSVNEGRHYESLRDSVLPQPKIEKVKRSIIGVSIDIRAALAARDSGGNRVATTRSDGEAQLANEPMREVAREQWLKYRAQHAGKRIDTGREMDAAAVPARRKGH